MRILNREKTHFMQANALGTYSVKFGSVVEVNALIDRILGDVHDRKPIDIAAVFEMTEIQKSTNTTT